MAYLNLPDVDICYEVYGEGPPLLFLSATAWRGGIWKLHQVPDLSRDHQVIIFDQRGTGQSAARGTDFSTERLVRDAIALLDHLDIGQVALCGHSNGGRVAQMLTADHPERVRKLILASAGGTHKSKGIPLGMCLGLVDKGYARYRHEHSIETGFSEDFVNRHPERVNPILKELDDNRAPLETFLRHVMGRQQSDTTSRLGEIRVPTLVMIGDDEDHGASSGATHAMDFAKTLASKIAGAKLAILFLAKAIFIPTQSRKNSTNSSENFWPAEGRAQAPGGNMMRDCQARLVRALALLFAFSSAAAAQSADEFFKAHAKLTLGVPAGAGGTYDTYTRLLARYLPKYSIPGTPYHLVVENVIAAGGLALANQAFNTAPKDGTFLAMVRGTTVQENVNGNPAAKFDGRRFAWIGNMNQEWESCIVNSDSPFKSIADLYTQELIAVGASGAGAQSYTFPRVYDDVLHMKFKVVTGYPGSPDRLLAMQRGELTGNCGIGTSVVLSTFSEQYKTGKIRLLLQAGIGKDPRFADVPNILDEAKTQADRDALQYMFSALPLGRPFATAGETPPDRVALLRRAFAQAVRDPGLIEEAGKMQLDLDPMDGEASAIAVDRFYATPRAVIDRVEKIVNANP